MESHVNTSLVPTKARLCTTQPGANLKSPFSAVLCNNKTMSLFARLFQINTSKLVPKLTQNCANFQSLVSNESAPVNPGGLFNMVSRSMIRVHFPRPSERRRVQRHGWKKRMSTAEGRRVLMNRMLKGRWVLSH